LPTPPPQGRVFELFRLDGQVAVVTGATGVLGGAIARGLAAAGARVAVLGRRAQRAEEVAGDIRARGGAAEATPADVLDPAALERVREDLLARHGRIDVLVNAAGGNRPEAIVPESGTFFDLTPPAVREVLELNLMGTLLPCQVFGTALARQGSGAILNVSSMAASRPLTRVVAYAAAKAAVDNLTRWLAVELARRHGPGLRVNAIAPGFFLGEQNRALLIGPDGAPTARGQAILAHTPAGRFGEPEELVATALWLCGPGAAFVTGVVVPVDGGFSAYAGV
ncbi:MAG TPA: SDR family oxidoreductase, partial [Terriglobales bacterium]|nr:SDR family oxidoreductase [Terriglobales bacterium]